MLAYTKFGRFVLSNFRWLQEKLLKTKFSPIFDIFSVIKQFFFLVSENLDFSV